MSTLLWSAFAETLTRSRSESYLCAFWFEHHLVCDGVASDQDFNVKALSTAHTPPQPAVHGSVWCMGTMYDAIDDMPFALRVFLQYAPTRNYAVVHNMIHLTQTDTGYITPPCHVLYFHVASTPHLFHVHVDADILQQAHPGPAVDHSCPASADMHTGMGRPVEDFAYERLWEMENPNHTHQKWLDMGVQLACNGLVFSGWLVDDGLNVKYCLCHDTGAGQPCECMALWECLPCVPYRGGGACSGLEAKERMAVARHLITGVCRRFVSTAVELHTDQEHHVTLWKDPGIMFPPPPLTLHPLRCMYITETALFNPHGKQHLGYDVSLRQLQETCVGVDGTNLHTCSIFHGRTLLVVEHSDIGFWQTYLAKQCGLDTFVYQGARRRHKILEAISTTPTIVTTWNTLCAEFKSMPMLPARTGPAPVCAAREVVVQPGDDLTAFKDAVIYEGSHMFLLRFGHPPVALSWHTPANACCPRIATTATRVFTSAHDPQIPITQAYHQYALCAPLHSIAWQGVILDGDGPQPNTSRKAVHMLSAAAVWRFTNTRSQAEEHMLAELHGAATRHVIDSEGKRHFPMMAMRTLYNSSLHVCKNAILQASRHNDTVQLHSLSQCREHRTHVLELDQDTPERLALMHASRLLQEAVQQYGVLSSGDLACFTASVLYPGRCVLTSPIQDALATLELLHDVVHVIPAANNPAQIIDTHASPEDAYIDCATECMVCREEDLVMLTLIPCRHAFCELCTTDLIRRNLGCAMCRQRIHRAVPCSGKGIDTSVSRMTATPATNEHTTHVPLVDHFMNCFEAVNAHVFRHPMFYTIQRIIQETPDERQQFVLMCPSMRVQSTMRKYLLETASHLVVHSVTTRMTPSKRQREWNAFQHASTPKAVVLVPGVLGNAVQMVSPTTFICIAITAKDCQSVQSWKQQQLPVFMNSAAPYVLHELRMQ